jgi:hypothetical protein
LRIPIYHDCCHFAIACCPDIGQVRDWGVHADHAYQMRQPIQLHRYADQECFFIELYCMYYMHVYTCSLVFGETHVQPLYNALWIIQYTWIHMVGDMTNHIAMCVILHKFILNTLIYCKWFWCQLDQSPVDSMHILTNSHCPSGTHPPTTFTEHSCTPMCAHRSSSAYDIGYICCLSDVFI